MTRKTSYDQRAGLLDPGLVARYYRLVGPVKRVLDVGCGPGCFGRLKPAADIEVHGVDHDEGAVETAGRFEATRRVDLDAGRLPYEDAGFDAVFAKDVLEHLKDPAAMAREIVRVLRPGGRVVVSVPMEYPWVVWADYTHWRGFTRDSLRLLLEDTGFEVFHVLPMGAIPLAGRLRLVDQSPTILALPGMRRLFGRSWEALAARPGASRP